MRKSHGFWTKSSKKLSKRIRSKGRVPITRMLQEFEVGSKVHIAIDTYIQKGMPHPRYQGKTGTIVGKRGRAYVVEVPDGKTVKTLISSPVHLKGQKGLI